MDVSIIIPVYNGEEHLHECVESALRQTINEYEIIFIDDGSTDYSAEIIVEYQKKYSFIKLIRQDNCGAAVARNRGLMEAKGDYIAFLDADDLYLDDHALQNMVEFCNKNNLNLCGSLRKTVLGDHFEDAEEYRDLFETMEPVEVNYFDYQVDYYYQSYVYRRKFLMDNSIYFPLLRRYQDPPFLVKALYIAEKYFVLPVEFYCYRRRSTKFIMNDIQVNATMEGILLNVIFAREHGLNKLILNTCNRLNKDFYYQIRDSLKRGNLDVIAYLLKIRDETIGVDVLNEYKFNLIDYLTRILSQQEKGPVYTHRFPFEEIPFGSKIAVWGAGVAGNSIVSLINDTGYCEIVIWVDSKPKENMMQGKKVLCPNCLNDIDFDFLIIAVQSRLIFDEVNRQAKIVLNDRKVKIVGPVESFTKE